MKTLWQSFAFLCCITVLTGMFYPALVGAVGWVIAREQAGGSLIKIDGKVIGSALIAQPFHEAGYFWPRPLVVSNLSPSSAQLKTAILQRRSDWAARTGVARELVPEDLLTGSASGFDPHVSPAGARVQVARVVKARALDEAEAKTLDELLEHAIEGHQLHALGEPRVNVLRLNRAVDEKFGTLKR